MEVAKKQISIRLDEDLIEMLKRVSQAPGTLYYDRDRTWLIEYAVRKTYAELTLAHDTKEVDGLPA